MEFLNQKLMLLWFLKTLLHWTDLYLFIQKTLFEHLLCITAMLGTSTKT